MNDEVVHGIPGARVLAAGDVVSVDCGAILAGWHGDAAFTTIVAPEEAPGADPADETLVETTEQAMWHGIAAIADGQRLVDIGAAIEDFVGRPRYGIVEEYGGHGIGTAMHQAPHVLNYRARARGPRLRPGICLAIEPMLTIGEPDTRVLRRPVDGHHRRRVQSGALGAHGRPHRWRPLGTHRTRRGRAGPRGAGGQGRRSGRLSRRA